MNMKKTAKKIVALGTGAGMVGATLMGALAVAPDLADYPDFVIDDNQFDGKIVVGAAAASQDIIGAIDIAASLQAASTSEVDVDEGTTTTEITGDAKKIGDSGDMLELGEDVNSVSETLTDGDLEMLSSGRISTQKSSTDYTQILDLGSASVELFENHDDVVDNFLKFTEGAELFNYELEFTSGLESDNDGGTLDDYEDEEIPFLGQTYSIVQATTLNANTGAELKLIAGDVSDTLEQGQTKTYTVDGNDYEVTVLVVGDNGNAKLLINGEVTDSMTEGDTDTVGGVEVGIREVLETSANYEGAQQSLVEFYLGANTVTLTDTDITDTTEGDIEVDIGGTNEDISDGHLTIRGTPGSNTYRINSIEYSLDLDSAYKSDAYLAAGDGLREKLDEPEGMINAVWDISFQGVTEPSTEEIGFDALGDDEYELTFTNQRGDEFTVPYAYADASGNEGFGEGAGANDGAFHFAEQYADLGTNNFDDSGTFVISQDDYVLLTDDDQTNDGDSYVVQWDDIDTDDGTLTFSNVGSGDSFEATYDTVYDSGADGEAVNAAFFSTPSGEIRLGGKDFSFWVRNTTGTDHVLAIDMNNDDDLAGVDENHAFVGDGNSNSTHEFVNVVTRNGAIITLSDALTITDDAVWNVTVTTDGEDIDTGNSDEATTFSFKHISGDNELDFGSFGTIAQGPIDDPDNDEREYAQTKYGAWFDVAGDDDGADDLTISYPAEQVEALVYVTGGEVGTSQTTTGGSTSTRLNVLPVGIAVLDSEVSVDDDNLLVVGGPCANTIAAELLDNPADCTEGFEAGMGMLKTFDTGDNVAVLVAGFSAQDTVQTSQVLARAATEDVEGLSGDSVEVVVAGENDVTVRTAMEDSVEEDSEAADEGNQTGSE